MVFNFRQNFHRTFKTAVRLNTCAVFFHPDEMKSDLLLIYNVKCNEYNFYALIVLDTVV